MSNLMETLPTQAVSPTKPKQGVPPPGPHPKRSTAMTQLLAMQDLLFTDAHSGEYVGPKRAMITRAWKELQEIKLRLQMKAPPKPIDVTELQKARERRRAARGDAAEASWRPKRKANVVPIPEPPATPQGHEADAKQC